MTVAALDTETTFLNKGNPYTRGNKFVVGEWWDGKTSQVFREKQQLDLSTTKRLVFFNAKFDIAWLRNIGVTLPDTIEIWDCQLAEFILGNQRNPYPSLESTSIKYGLGNKIDVISMEYWDKGINTDQIPSQVLEEYLHQDCHLTLQIYYQQLEEFKKPEHRGKYLLFRLHCRDLLVLQEMEHNGIYYDVQGSLKASEALQVRIDQLDKKIKDIYPDVPLNIGSGDHLSCVLYGGTILVEDRIPIGVYKTGAKEGQTRYKIVELNFDLPRLIEPLKGSELKKDGYYSTDEATLRSLRPNGKARVIIEALLERRGLEKLRGTYLSGLPKRIDDMDWGDSLLHGQLNQCVASTGRLSSTKPNTQNLSGEVKKYCKSRYAGGYIVQADAKSLEWISYLFLSQDKVGIQEWFDFIANPKLNDIHTRNQNDLNLISRLIAKIFLFRCIYRGPAYAYAMDPEFSSVSRSEKFWQKVIDNFFNKYKGLNKKHIQLIQEATTKGCNISPFGRVHEHKARETRQGLKWNESDITNHINQGCGADDMAVARVLFYHRFKSSGINGVLISTVHDSIVCDVPTEEDALQVAKLMHGVFKDLPKAITKFYGVEWNLPLLCEVSAGPNMKDLTVIA